MDTRPLVLIADDEPAATRLVARDLASEYALDPADDVPTGRTRRPLTTPCRAGPEGL